MQYNEKRDEIQEGEECLVGRPALSDNSYVGGEYDIIYKKNKPRYKKGDVPVPGRIGVTNLGLIKNVEIVNGGIYLSGTVEFQASIFHFSNWLPNIKTPLSS